MGRLAKNPQLTKNAGVASSGQMPGGSTAERPSDTNDGQTRWNETTSALEYWSGSAWEQVGKTGIVPIVKDTYTGTGAQTAFTSMSETVAADADVLVFVGGVFQNPTVAYTVSGTTITFTSAPPNLETIVVLHGYNEVA